jgi:hypothetical protein
MPYAFVFYPDPPTARVTLTPDSGTIYASQPYTHEDGREGQVCFLAEATPDNQGASAHLARGTKRSSYAALQRMPTRCWRVEVDDCDLSRARRRSRRPPRAARR